MHMNFDAAYYGDLRSEIVAMIPGNCTSVLDVGCGYGVLGKYLKAQGVANVCGIEVVPAAAAEAEKVLDTVVSGNVETMDLPFTAGQFDCIVCADVLEHLVDPWRMLTRLKRLLKPDGCIVASIPNIGYHRVIRGLLKGQWRYAKSGVLDQTHLRFFTLEGIQSMFADNEMRIETMDRKIAAGLNVKLLNMLLLGAIREALVIQYIIKAVNVTPGR
jgi:2-polyprenyl-3-methyl-5-hydroxy-6-metoxy-1,4-benzoquinol methylase